MLQHWINILIHLYYRKIYLWEKCYTEHSICCRYVFIYLFIFFKLKLIFKQQQKIRTLEIRNVICLCLYEYDDPSVACRHMTILFFILPCKATLFFIAVHKKRFYYPLMSSENEKKKMLLQNKNKSLIVWGSKYYDTSSFFFIFLLQNIYGGDLLPDFHCQQQTTNNNINTWIIIFLYHFKKFVVP